MAMSRAGFQGVRSERTERRCRSVVNRTNILLHIVPVIAVSLVSDHSSRETRKHLANDPNFVPQTGLQVPTYLLLLLDE